ncbi:nucleotidyl transferase AbiEii/AbiGii toxin family protein [Kaistella haifensis]|nr:nucleotidyl transferase AbiEii/AbiGii toxin family protein [Kaistella haifensis]
MNLHENKTLFQLAIRFTAQEMKIPDLYIEKDYWVTFALKQIFSEETKEYCVFKGGTALSKCYGIVERFSEDIDLVIMKTGEESANQLKNRLKKVSQILEKHLPEVAVTNITQKMGMNRKTAHTYSKEFQGNYGQIRDVIIVEASWLGYYEPYEQKKVHTFISEMMLRSGQENLIEEYGLQEFPVNVLKLERTFCEKIMSLVRFSYSEDYIADLKSKIRHTYDLHQMLQQKEILDFFESEDFEKMLNKVGQDDVASYKNDNEWLKFHPKDSRFFAKLDEIWEQLEQTYKTDFRNLVYGELPDSGKVKLSLERLKYRIEQIVWSVEV